ncbi:MaoC family dehydratase [Nocardioides sp. NPDC092400]|uniref:MaoC family dehydratase n=1 Tax=Nocardioides sp. NPDC092400 TaxID=3155196 RepID=UPI003428F271
MRTFDGLPALAGAAGTDLGVGSWSVVDQVMVDGFAGATGDHQWIHVDTERAVSGPFGATIAHGMLTLSLLPPLMHELYEVRGVSMAINYGFDKVRFAAPVRVGSRVRVGASIAAVADLDGAAQVTFAGVVHLEGSPKPAAAADFIVRFVA